MEENRKNIKKLVVLTITVIAVMVTAMIVLAHDNDLFKPGKPSGSDGRWKIEFTSIAEGEKTGSATSRHRPEYTATRASFFVDFVAPGDSITYDLQVANLGNLDSVLSNIILITSPNKEAIKYEIIDIKEGDRLDAGEVRNFKIKVSYDLEAQEVVTFNKPVSITFEFRQAF